MQRRTLLRRKHMSENKIIVRPGQVWTLRRFGIYDQYVIGRQMPGGKFEFWSIGSKTISSLKNPKDFLNGDWFLEQECIEPSSGQIWFLLDNDGRVRTDSMHIISEGDKTYCSISFMSSGDTLNGVPKYPIVYVKKMFQLRRVCSAPDIF